MASNQATGQEAGAVYVSVMPSGRGFSKAMDSDLDGAFTGAASRGTKTFGQMFRRVAAAGAAILATLGLGKLVKETISLGVSYNTLEQTSRAAFTTILGSSEAAATMMGEIREFAKTSPFPRQAFIEATRQMLGFGFAAKDVVPTLAIIQDAVAAMGGGADEIALLTDVFSKIKSTGRVMADDLNRLAEVGINAWDILAKASGVSIDEMRKSVGEGSVDAATSIAQLTQGMQDRFGGAAENIKGTWLGSVDRIKGAWRDISSILVAPFIDPEGGGYAVTWANKVADALRGLEGSQALAGVQSKLRDIAENMSGTVDKIAGAIPLLSMDGGLGRFVDALGGMFPAIGFINTVAKSLAPAMPAIGSALVEIGKALLSEGVMDALVQLIVEVLPPLVDLLVAVAPLIPPIAQFLTSLLVPALTGTSTAVNDAKRFFEGLAKFLSGDISMKEWVKTVMTLPGSIGPIFREVGGMVLGTLNWFIGAANSYTSALERAINGIRSLLGMGSITMPKIPKYNLDKIPGLADSGTVLPRPGGTLILAAEAGRAESVVDTGKLNDLMDRAGNGGGGGALVGNLYLDSGEFLGVVRGEIRSADRSNSLTDRMGRQVR